MNPTELKAIIQNGESGSVEFKVATPRELEMAQRLCGLANSQTGGLFIIGVTDESWQIVGVENPSKDIDDVLKAARKCDPSLELSAPEVVEIDGKKLVVVRVPPNTGKIYQVGGTYLLRRGTHTSAMTTSELMRFMYRQNALHWEIQPVLNADLSDLDMGKVKAYQENLVRMSRRSATNTPTDLTELLVKIGCAVKVQAAAAEDHDDHHAAATPPPSPARIYPTHAGLLLFGRAPDEFLTQAEVVLTYYQDSSGIRRYNDRRIITGSLEEQIEKSWEMLRLWTPVSGRIEGFRRIDEPALPLEALREAIVNALVHRDYSLEGTAVRIFYYPDRVEIYNPGLLVPGLTLEQLQRGEAPSNPRNPIITTVLRDLPGGFMERVGSGVRFMINQMRDLGLSDPQFKEQGEFVVTFRRKELVSLAAPSSSSSSSSSLSPYQRPQSELPPIDKPVPVPKNLQITGEEEPPVAVEAAPEEAGAAAALVSPLEQGLNKKKPVSVPGPTTLAAANNNSVTGVKLTAAEKLALDAAGRQRLALQYVREYGSISHKVYQELTGASENTATRDLKQLVSNGALRQVGRGPARKYVI